MHFSLDIWNTLISSNPEFSKARNAIVSERLDISYDLAKSILSKTKIALDKEAEDYGIGYSHEMIYSKLAIEFYLATGRSYWEINEILQKASYDIQDLFLKHPPVLLDSIVSEILNMQRDGHTFSFASNNNYVNGRTIIRFFEQKGLKFLFGIFSSEEKTAKPNPEFWRVLEILSGVYKIDIKKIIHIGDSPICDNPNGIVRHKIITNPYELVGALKELINE